MARLRDAPSAAASATAAAPVDLLRFVARDWYRDDPVPEHALPTSVTSDPTSYAEHVWSYRVAAAHRRWSDAGFAWAREHGISDREWLSMRPLSQGRRGA